MEQIVNLIVCFLMISTIDRIHSYPAPSEILSGPEFLSLLMEPEVRSSRSSSSSKSTDSPRLSSSHRGSRKFSHVYYGHAEDEESVLPIEALFTSQEDLSRSSSRGYGYRSKYRPRSGKLLSSTSTTTTEAAGDDLAVAASEISISSSETTNSGGEIESTTTTVLFSEETDATYSSTVTSTTSTITSTSQRSWLNTRRKTLSTTKSSKILASENERTVDSNSYRSELTIEESAPSTSGTEDVHGESSNIHRVIAPLGQQQARGRMQRKQDSAATPLQTVIYHDKKNDKDQPRSVSYSFIGETAPTLKTWKDIDQEYLPLKNESDNTPVETVDTPTTVQVILEPAKIWSEQEKNYSEPAKVWSEPAKIYSEPAKIYSEPAKIYSEPARIYSEPAKIYSRPSSYWQTLYDKPKPSTTSTPNPSDEPKRLVFNELDKIPYDELNAPADGDETGSIHNAIGKFVPKQVHEPPKKQLHKPTPDPTEIIDPYVEKQGAGNGDSATVVQTLAPAAGSSEDSKVGYVVDGRNYRKYRVEEKTPDGFIVGEYGVLSHNDGNLRGVRYTADSDINPRLIYDALLKFLSL
ncbi:serine-rich adhesin for platelets [Culex pipiens pallens]|uniref:serine-rich adhesin for platelets n=1 Tax=Culex pipiens pallens TaxID=42434 RepID=UPI001952B597|nr:serine-rich adhesin for platelets [Culex pipiens pallens]